MGAHYTGSALYAAKYGLCLVQSVYMGVMSEEGRFLNLLLWFGSLSKPFTAGVGAMVPHCLLRTTSFLQFEP